MSIAWKRDRISALCSIIVDCVNRTAPVVDAVTPYRMIRTTNIRDGRIDLTECRYVDEATFARWTRRAEVLDGDVILTREAPIGEVGLIRGHGKVFLGQRLMQFRASPEKIDSQFLYYSFLAPDLQHQFGTHEGSGSVVSHIRVADCHNFQVSYPPLPEQRAIAATLGALDDKIELNRKMNATLEAMARALFRDWFVDFGPTRAKMAGSAPYLSPDLWSLFPDHLDDEGKPEGWETSQLLELASLISGGTPKTDNPEFWDGGISWASAKDVSQCKDAFLVHTDRNISEAGLKNSATKIVPRNSTVIVARGATTGRSCLFGSDIAMNQTCYALASRYGQPLWLNCAFGELVDRLVNAAHGSVFDTITTRTLEGISLVAGPLNLRAAFEEIVAPLFARILANIHESRTLAQTRDLLLPRLMSGELRVAEAERIVSEVA